MNEQSCDVRSTENGNPESRPAPRPEHEEAPVARYLAVGLAVVAGLIRVIPHPWNFTPVTALGLFGGARLRLWQALTLPFLVMAISDLVIWWMLGWKPFNPLVYSCFAATVLLGVLLRRTKSWLRIGASSIAATVLFFLVTNFGVWYSSRVDPQTLPAGAGMVWETEGSKYPIGMVRYADNAQGLLTCYVLGLSFAGKDAPPLGFAGNWLVGDLFFTGLLFGAYAWLARLSGRTAARPQAVIPGGQPPAVSGVNRGR